MKPPMADGPGKYVVVDGIRTHYLEAGTGPHLVLLHSGEFGGCSELSWEFNIAPLAEYFHVLAPDFVGFGRSDKLRDFTNHGTRMIRHITKFLEIMCVDQADFIGNSIAGRFLCRVAGGDPPQWPIRRMICAAGAGVEPDNHERRALQNYDATPEGMRRVLQALFHAPKWWIDENYVHRRHELSLLPGAWEVAAAARFKSPAVPGRPSAYGRPDRTPYERIRVPTLYIAGANDRLLEPGYEKLVAERTPNGRSIVFDNCGHCPNIECANRFNEAALNFLLAPDREIAPGATSNVLGPDSGSGTMG
jgi:pimeloyl-ACP methyl ester carboxylesterase